MANKQIILTQNNSGIEIQAHFIDDKKQSIDLTGNTVEVSIVYPSLKIEFYDAQVINIVGGIASLVLSSNETEEVGLHKMYWSAVDSAGEITAQDDIFYYVKKEYGGAEVI